MVKVLELQHQSFQWIFRVDFLLDSLVWSPCCPRDSPESSPAPQSKSINSSAFSLLYGPTLISIHDYWKNHSFDYADLCWQSMSLLFNMLSTLVKSLGICSINSFSAKNGKKESIFTIFNKEYGWCDMYWNLSIPVILKEDSFVLCQQALLLGKCLQIGYLKWKETIWFGLT